MSISSSNLLWRMTEMLRRIILFGYDCTKLPVVQCYTLGMYPPLSVVKCVVHVLNPIFIHFRCRFGGKTTHLLTLCHDLPPHLSTTPQIPQFSSPVTVSQISTISSEMSPFLFSVHFRFDHFDQDPDALATTIAWERPEAAWSFSSCEALRYLGTSKTT